MKTNWQPGHLGGDARENLVVLRQVFWQRLRAPIDRGVPAQSELGATDLNRRDIDRLVVDGKIGQPDQLLRIVHLFISRFHEIAADEVIDGRKTAGDRMPPGRALASARRMPASCAETLSMPTSRNSSKERACTKAVAQGRSRLAVPFNPGVAAEDAKPVPVEHLQPALDGNLPVRMLAEESADDLKPDRLLRGWRRRQYWGCKSGAESATDSRPIERL
jgi:hypothetical protein